MAERVLIEHLEFVLTADEENTVLTDAAILVEDGSIADLGPTDQVAPRHPDARRVSGRNRGAVPGLIDTHVHLSETLSRAAFPDVLSTRAWVFHWAKPFYAHVSEDDEYVSALLSATEMLRAGTTCFLDMGAQTDAGTVVRAVEEAGLRGVTGRHAADRKPERLPPGWTEEMAEHHFFPDADTALRALEEFWRRFHGAAGGRIRCWINIEGKEPCSLELHVGARALAERLGVGTTYHLATSLEEAELSEQRYGAWPITRVARAGGLGPNLVLAHAVAVRDEEVALLAEAGTGVAFCPSSSLKLAKGATSIGRYPEMLSSGVRVTLGTDGVSASGNLNLLRQVHLVAGLFKDARRDPALVGGRQAFRMATLEAARALRWDDEIGSIEVGKRADLVLFDLNHPEWVPYTDPLQALVWSATSASVAETWVEGRPLYREGRVLTVDEAALREEARARGRAIRRRAGLDRADVPVTTDLYA
ncbi:MAG TPA: amidohydrolase family protein [Actinomycetota bacterium]|nr:amidohydrolase family protein [Actinomycetota bacterium]